MFTTTVLEVTKIEAKINALKWYIIAFSLSRSYFSSLELSLTGMYLFGSADFVTSVEGREWLIK